MADKMTFELVSPERQLASAEADMVVIPGMEGDFGALPGHTPFMTTLRPGLVTVTNGSDTMEYFVTGGFAEVSNEGAAVLAEEAVERSGLTKEFIDGKITAAEAALESASEENRQAAGQRLNNLKAAAEHLI